jgi:hypothetical protein
MCFKDLRRSEGGADQGPDYKSEPNHRPKTQLDYAFEELLLDIPGRATPLA